MKHIFTFLKTFFIFLSGLYIITSSEAAAADNANGKIRLAIVDLQPKGVSKVVSAAVTDLIRSNMVDTGRFVVVERSQMDAIFKEHELQQSGCTDNACMVEIGKLLSANKIMIGEINKLATDYIITVRIVDVEKGVAEFSTNEKAKNIEEIDKTVKTLVDKLTVRITGKRSIAGETGASDYYLRGIIPGWAQIYAGKTLEGGLYMGGFVLAGCAWAYSYFNYTNKKKSYHNLKPTDSQNTFNSKYDDYKQSFNVMVYISALWGLIYVANWVDVLWLTDSPGLIVSRFPNNGGYVRFDAVNIHENDNMRRIEEMTFNLNYSINF